jgi:lipopolysaccharide export system protein LptA
MPLMPRLLTTLRALPLIIAAALASGSAFAERADRSKPLEVVADRQGTIDMLKQVVVFTGNVVITKGTLNIKADRVEVREGPDGYRTAVAIGGNSKASFSQKRDGVDETIQGTANRLEFEERGDVVRFIDDARVRRMEGSAVRDEITGELITYNGTTEVFTVSGNARGAASAASGASGGRVRAVLAPRAGTEAARDAAGASGGERR